MNKDCVIDLMKKIYPGQAISDETVDEFLKIFKELSDREQAVLNLKYGLVDGVQASFDEVAETYGVTREKIEKMTSAAFKKLRHPTRSKKLFNS